jgi:hypothetical protein
MPSRKPSLAIGMIAAISTAAVLAGCGSSGSSNVTPASYVKSVCSAVAPFEKDVQSRSSALNQTTVNNPAQGKQALQRFLTAVAADTDRTVSQIKSAGTPNVSNGKAIQTAMVSAFTQLQSAMHHAASQANSLSTTSPAAFKTGADALGGAVRSSITSIGSSLNGLKNADLEKAASSEPSCKSLGA